MSELQDFLNLIESSDTKTFSVTTTTEKQLNVSPLSFKQQKKLITSGLDGIVGSMVFIKTLNEIILENTSNSDLKIYDRIPITLALRKQFKEEPVVLDDSEINLDDILSKIKPFKNIKNNVIEGEGFSVVLKIPTLQEENKYLSLCIDELKRNDNNELGKNLSTILSYEIPKFIDSFKFQENEIKMSGLSFSDKTKIMDNLPANITNKITNFILKVREYDEKILTIDGKILEIDSNFFE